MLWKEIRLWKLDFCIWMEKLSPALWANCEIRCITVIRSYENSELQRKRILRWLIQAEEEAAARRLCWLNFTAFCGRVLWACFEAVLYCYL